MPKKGQPMPSGISAGMEMWVQAEVGAIREAAQPLINQLVGSCGEAAG